MSNDITLSWLRLTWFLSRACWSNNEAEARLLWRAAVREEANRRTIAALRERIATLEAEQWTPMAVMTNDENDILLANQGEVTIGHDGVGLATFGWPEDEYEYAVCRRKGSEGEVANGE